MTPKNLQGGTVRIADTLIARWNEAAAPPKKKKRATLARKARRKKAHAAEPVSRTMKSPCEDAA